MCDRAGPVQPGKEEPREACDLVRVQQPVNVQIIQQKVAMEINAISVKPEPSEFAMSLQTASRWIRDVVDPTFGLKPIEFQVKATPASSLESRDTPAFSLTFEPYTPPEQDNKTDAVTAPPPPPGAHYCTLCSRRFTRQSNLTEHMLRHAGKLYACHVCHKQFSCLRYLARHSRVHCRDNVKKTVERSSNTDKGYVCTYCEKSFSCKSHLVAHTRIHTGEKPFSCLVCSKPFNHKSHLTAHLRIHTGEKPFHCRICHKQFRDQSNLAGHMRVHNGQKPFACSECAELFTHRSHLKKHMREHQHAPPPHPAHAPPPHPAHPHPHPAAHGAGAGGGKKWRRKGEKAQAHTHTYTHTCAGAADTATR